MYKLTTMHTNAYIPEIFIQRVFRMMRPTANNPFSAVQSEVVASLVEAGDEEEAAALAAEQELEKKRIRAAVSTQNIIEAEDSSDDEDDCNAVAGGSAEARTGSTDAADDDSAVACATGLEALDAELGFVGAFSGGSLSDWRLWHGGKVGGRPVWLNPTDLPAHDALVCAHCGDPLLFLAQVYAPVDRADGAAYHRILYIFCCRRAACLRAKAGGAGAVRVLRAQLPKANPFTPPAALCASPNVDLRAGPLRVDPNDGEGYSKASFFEEYGGLEEWNAAVEVLGEGDEERASAADAMAAALTEACAVAAKGKRDGNRAFAAEDWAEAVIHYTEALSAIAKLQAVFPGALAAGDDTDAIGTADAGASINTATKESLNDSARILFANRSAARTKGAAALTARMEDPNGTIDDSSDANIELRDGLLLSALRDADKAAVLDPSWPKAQYRRAQALGALGRRDAADAALYMLRRLKKLAKKEAGDHASSTSSSAIERVGCRLKEYELFCEPEPPSSERKAVWREQDDALAAAFTKRHSETGDTTLRDIQAAKEKAAAGDVESLEDSGVDGREGRITRRDLREAASYSAGGETASRICTDSQVRRFQRRVACRPTQCLRYARWENGAVLWASSERQLGSRCKTENKNKLENNNATASANTKANGDEGCRDANKVLSKSWTMQQRGVGQVQRPPVCEWCGSARAFEMQLMPQLLHFCSLGLDDGSADWDTLMVYTCAESCSSSSHRIRSTSEATGGEDSGRSYTEEYAWVQTSSVNFTC